MAEERDERDERDERGERDRLRFKLVLQFSAGVPHNRALGIRIEEVTQAGTLFRLPYDGKLVGNPDTGVLHGGAITALLDGASGAAVFATLTDFVPIATLDLRIDYLRPAEPGKDVMCRASCYKMTRNVAFTRAVAYHDDPEDPIAHSVGTFMVSTKTGTVHKS
ncbi:MAG: PaaI family thioesterase [Kofleriaceae bacterium]